jgi:hypothetical protein
LAAVFAIGAPLNPDFRWRSELIRIKRHRWVKTLAKRKNDDELKFDYTPLGPITELLSIVLP